MKKLICLSVVITSVLGLLFYQESAFANADLPWTTSYNCTDWQQTSPISSNPNCDGLIKNLDSFPAGFPEQVTVNANFIGGAGGKGQRHWLCDGTNVNSGGTTVTFNTSQTEMWARWYMRFQPGFQWSSYQGYKALYLNYGGYNNLNYFMIAYNADQLSYYTQFGDATHYNCDNCGWLSLYGAQSDGSWHSFEIHVKSETSSGNDGIYQLWVDGALKVDQRKVNHGLVSSGRTLSGFVIGSNAKVPSNGVCNYVDYDDISVASSIPANRDSANNPMIGPIGWSGSVTTIPIPTTPVNGACGSSNGKSFTTLTSGSSNLCLTGTVASFSGTGPWTWGCNGSGGGTSTSSTACSALLSSTPTAPLATQLFSESFENNSYASRGWYDNTNHGTIVSGGQSGNSLQWAWASGATTPTNGGSMRMQFTPTDTLYLSYYVKFQTGWRGSQKAYHPHLFYILSDLDNTASAYSPLANNYLDTYVEFLADIGSPYTIRPIIAIQDQKRVNTSNGTPPNNLTAITENRSVAYCNTPVSAGATGTCYADIPYYSASTWKASTASLTTNAWHHVEVYLKMNSISGGKGLSNGIMQEWIDGVQVVNRSDVLYRTNQDATKKWAQFVMAPYIGDGSPIAQSMWIDELTVGTSLPLDKATISAPTGLKVK